MAGPKLRGVLRHCNDRHIMTYSVYFRLVYEYSSWINTFKHFSFMFLLFFYTTDPLKVYFSISLLNSKSLLLENKALSLCVFGMQMIIFLFTCYVSLCKIFLLWYHQSPFWIDSKVYVFDYVFPSTSIEIWRHNFCRLYVIILCCFQLFYEWNFVFFMNECVLPYDPLVETLHTRAFVQNTCCDINPH